MATRDRKPIRTELQLKKLKPEDKQYDVRIEFTTGLVVRVGKSGIKKFRWDRGYGQKPRIVTYGEYPNLSLKEAIERHDKLKQQYKDGSAAEFGTDTPKTIRELSVVFYADRIIPARKRPEIVKQVLDHDILPVIGSMKIAAVNTLVVRNVVKKVVDRGAVVHAGRVLAIMKQLLGFGTSIGVLEYNTALPLKKIDLGIEDNQSDRALTHDEIKQFWMVLDTVPRLSMQTRSALQLLILLGLRSGELRQVKWADINTDAGLLTIPVENQKLSPNQTKKAKPFLVPLDSFALELFQKLNGLNDIWVFPGKEDKTDNEVKGPITDKVLGRAVRRLLVKEIDGKPALPVDKFTPHDLRRTMRSNLSALGVPPHIAERCLNHSLGSIISIYDQHDYLDERREALEKWSQQVQIIIGLKGNVVLMEAV